MDETILNALEHDQTIDITTTGRKSGLPRRIEIWFANLDGRLYIRGGIPGRRDWLANLKANSHFTFHLKESVHADLPATARIVDDVAERREIFSQLSSAHGAQLEAQVRDSALVEVILTQDGGTEPS